MRQQRTRIPSSGQADHPHFYWVDLLRQQSRHPCAHAKLLGQALSARTTSFLIMKNPSQTPTRTQVPYTLLLDPETGRAAAYNSTNQLLTELASKELVAFALANARQDLPFDVAGHAATPTRRPPPAWATIDVQERMRLIWIQHPDSQAPASEWLEIPAK